MLETEHFDLYYYEIEHSAALDVARMAERSYTELSTVLRHQFRERKPIILYASLSDFQQTNTSGEEVQEGVGGFTDFLKHRIVIPLTGAYDDVQHVLQHEMTHQFQYDVWSGGRAGGGVQTIVSINPPLWFVEGMAEYMSLGKLDANTAMWLRDAAQEGKLPTISAALETDPRIFPYRFGQAILSYIGQRWGDEAIGAILSASRSGSLEGAFRRVIGLDFKQLGDQWRDAVDKEYLPELNTADKAPAMSHTVLTKERSQGTLHLAPALSPDGTKVAYFSEKDFYFVDLWLGKRCRRQGRAASVQVDVQLELRNVPLHQLIRELVTGREIPCIRRQERRARRHHCARRGAEQAGRHDSVRAQRRDDAGVESRWIADRLYGV